MKQSISRRRFGMVVGVGVAGLAVPRDGQAQIVPRTPIIIKSGSLRIASATELVETGSGPFTSTTNLGTAAFIDYLDLEDDDLDLQPDQDAAGERTVEFVLGGNRTGSLAVDAQGKVTLTLPDRLEKRHGGNPLRGRFHYRLKRDAESVKVRRPGGNERGGQFKKAMLIVRTS